MIEAFFDFEKPIANLERKLQDLRDSQHDGIDFSSEIHSLEKKVESLIHTTCSQLNSWQRVQLSRHPSRPYARDYIDLLFPDFMELSGDRTFGEDQALIGGIASWPPVLPQTPREKGSSSVLILGHQKGRSTKQKMERNFGMVRPEGYRKAMRLMELAERFQMPILSLIDTPGAYPGIEAEERGQSQAIAESILRMFELKVPILSVVIGEGGSGGALAIGIADQVLMMEYSTYSVISPESCASILWSDSSLAERASEKLKMSPSDLLRLGVIDKIIPEPKGGAHRDWVAAGGLLQSACVEALQPVINEWKQYPKRIISKRIEKFRKIGVSALEKTEAVT